MDGVKVALGSRGIGVEAVRQSAKDRKEWRALLHIKIIEFLVEIYAWFLCCLGPPSRALVAYYLERGGMPLQHVVGDRKSTRLNSSHSAKSRMPSSA